MQLVAFLFVPVLVLWACEGRPSFDHVRNLSSRGTTIVSFGDSLTEGVGAGPGEDYPSVSSRKLQATVVNAGRRGDTAGLALSRLSLDVLDKNPRLVIVFIGGNDFLRRIPLSETRSHLEEIVRRIQAHGAMVVLAGIKLGLFTDEYGAMYEELAEKYGALYVPRLLEGILSDTSLRSDPIHPNGAGYRLIAERLAERVKPLLEEADRRLGRSAGVSSNAPRRRPG